MRVFDKDLLQKNKKVILLLASFLVIFVVLDYGYAKVSAFFHGQQGNTKRLVINEIMASNQGAYADSYGELYDWIELYNGTDTDISLLNYSLNDQELGNNIWMFPDVTIKSGEYLVIYLTGLVMEEKDGLYVPFALNKDGGEVITLKDEKGIVIDSVPLPSLKKNTVLARDEIGTFITTKEITPGYANTAIGRNHYLESLNGFSSLVITEFLPKNKGIYFKDGELYPYIEIQNQGKETLSLKDFYLSDDSSRPFLWRFPDIELEPNEVYLVYATGIGKDNHTSFSIDKKEGELILSHKNEIVEVVPYNLKESGNAVIRIGNEFLETTDISPGYANTVRGKLEYAKEDKAPNDLIISEVMNGNHQYLKQKNGEYYDWIELYNNSNEVISLKNYMISTSQNNRSGFTLPNYELNPGEYYILHASNKVSLGSNHANFTLSKSESIYLYKDEKLIDSIYYYDVPIKYSYGRGKDCGHYYYSKPTPNKNNNQGILEFTLPPTFSKKSGVYENVESITVELKGEGTIYYTLDGSIPTTKSKVYKEPIILSKTTVIRAIAQTPGRNNSSAITSSYIINEGHTLDVMSISLPNSSFQKLNNNPNSRTLVELAHAEFFEKGSSFSVDCGLKLFGGESRELDKKSYALKFSTKYGVSSLEYPVFDNRDIEKYDTLVLRSGSQDMMSAMLRDELGTSIMVDYGSVDAQSFRPIVLYVNGEYWGVYYIREKIDDDFIEKHYNVDGKNTNIVRIEGGVDEGNGKDYQALMKYVKSHDLSIPENYEYVKKNLDIDNYIEFVIGQFYTNNYDVRNTRFFNNPAIFDNKLRMIYYDLDYSFFQYPANYLTWLMDFEGSGYFKVDNSLIRGLMKNEEFKERFVELFFYNIKYVWTKEHVLSRYQEIYNRIKPEMKRNQERWGYSYEEWEKECQKIEKFILGREQDLLRQVKNFFHLSDEEILIRMNKNHRLKDILNRKNIFLEK